MWKKPTLFSPLSFVHVLACCKNRSMMEVSWSESPASEGFLWCQIIFCCISALWESIVTIRKKKPGCFEMFSWCPRVEKCVLVLQGFIANIPKAVWPLMWDITACGQRHRIMKFVLWEQIQVLYKIIMLQLSHVGFLCLLTCKFVFHSSNCIFPCTVGQSMLRAPPEANSLLKYTTL